MKKIFLSLLFILISVKCLSAKLTSLEKVLLNEIINQNNSIPDFFAESTLSTKKLYKFEINIYSDSFIKKLHKMLDISNNYRFNLSQRVIVDSYELRKYNSRKNGDSNLLDTITSFYVIADKNNKSNYIYFLLYKNANKNAEITKFSINKKAIQSLLEQNEAQKNFINNYCAKIAKPELNTGAEALIPMENDMCGSVFSYEEASWASFILP